MSSDVSIPGGILDCSVVSLSRVGLELEVNPVSMVLGDEAKVDKVDVVLLGAAITLKNIK